jgi:hypothetical protein
VCSVAAVATSVAISGALPAGRKVALRKIFTSRRNNAPLDVPKFVAVVHDR